MTIITIAAVVYIIRLITHLQKAILQAGILPLGILILTTITGKVYII